MADDNESQSPQRSEQEKDKAGDIEGQNAIDNSFSERYSHEFSQNVEANSNRSSEIKYLVGEKLEAGGLQSSRYINAQAPTFEQKQKSIGKRFITVYNQQGHYSTSQSIMQVYGATMCSIARCLQFAFCCQCAGCCRIQAYVDHKRFLINLTKLAALLMIAITIAFIALTINEHIAMASSNGAGAFLFKQATISQLPRQALS